MLNEAVVSGGCYANYSCVEVSRMTPDVVAVNTMAGYLTNAAFAYSEVRRFDMYPFLNTPAFTELQNGRRLSYSSARTSSMGH